MAELPEPAAFLTEHEQGPMLWLDRQEALRYADEETPPVLLYTADQLRAAIQAERGKWNGLMRLICDLSDSSMRDGDEARDLAAQALGFLDYSEYANRGRDDI